MVGLRVGFVGFRIYDLCLGLTVGSLNPKP